ncbi:MAG: MiaB/RimO family radical SAM methylthiotransferase, partial [Ruminococcus sp.]|nr:MiaB/RimO family radical SAM methylthiotransferase [Ruminococcus sp.]
CTVTSQADLKCRQLIRNLRKDSPDGVIVMAGCFAQAYKEKAEELSECDIIVGTSCKEQIPQLVEEYISTGKRIVRIEELRSGSPLSAKNRMNDGKTRAYIKIQDGCRCFCTYCVIPFARGPLRSKPLEDIFAETRTLVENGHKEIVLTGINLCFYGKETNAKASFIDAVEAACSVQGDHRVRLGSIEPEMLTDDDIDRLAGLDKLCPHFHLSLQSGCSETLKRMNRRYTAEQYHELCKKLRKRFPDCAITTDIMVGFPMESQEEFESSLAFAEMIGFAQAHIFPYSRRAGTKADKMSGQVEKAVKHQRAALMRRVCDKSENEYLCGMVGKTVRVLFERETDPEWHQGHAENYSVVKVKKSDDRTLWKTFADVKITSAEKGFCIGEIIQKGRKL